MSKVIPLRANPDLTRETVRDVYDRVRELRDKRPVEPVGVTVREATVLVASMNDMNAGSDRGLATEPEIGDEGTVFGHPFVVVAIPF